MSKSLTLLPFTVVLIAPDRLPMLMHVHVEPSAARSGGLARLRDEAIRRAQNEAADMEGMLSTHAGRFSVFAVFSGLQRDMLDHPTLHRIPVNATSLAAQELRS